MIFQEQFFYVKTKASFLRDFVTLQEQIIIFLHTGMIIYEW